MAGRSRAVFVLFLLACTSRDATDASAPLSDATADDASSCPFCDGGYTYDAPGPPDALPPPDVDCVDGGDDAALCPLPHSVCVNDRWLEFFDNGVCEDGGCRFDVHLRNCKYYGLCYDGGCTTDSFTSPAP